MNFLIPRNPKTSESQSTKLHLCMHLLSLIDMQLYIVLVLCVAAQYIFIYPLYKLYIVYTINLHT